MHRVLNLLNIDFSIQSLLCYLICIKGSFTLFRLKTWDQKLCVRDVCTDGVAGTAVKCQLIWECWRTEYIFFVVSKNAIRYKHSFVIFSLFWCGFHTLTHWGQDKMDVILHMTFSKSFTSMMMYKFQLKFHWILFPVVQLTIFQHWFR